jgi:hypothetical protein
MGDFKSEKVNIPARQFATEYGYSVNPASHGNSGPVETSFPPFIPLYVVNDSPLQ